MPATPGHVVPATVSLGHLSEAHHIAGMLGYPIPQASVSLTVSDGPQRPQLHSYGCAAADRTVDAQLLYLDSDLADLDDSPCCSGALHANVSRTTDTWRQVVHDLFTAREYLPCEPCDLDPLDPADGDPASAERCWADWVETTAFATSVREHLPDLTAEVVPGFTAEVEELEQAAAELASTLASLPTAMADHALWSPQLSDVAAGWAKTSADPLRTVPRQMLADVVGRCRSAVRGIDGDPTVQVTVIDAALNNYTSRVVGQFPSHTPDDRFTVVDVPERIARWWTAPQHPNSPFVLTDDLQVGELPESTVELLVTLWDDRTRTFQDPTGGQRLDEVYADARRLSFPR